MSLTRQEVAQKFARVEQIVSATTKRPTIVNESSKFVVITYWWGRGRENFNTARPCGEFYESLLDKPTHLLSPLTATPQKFRTALLRNASYQTFVDKKIRDYMGLVHAHVREGKPLSALYREKTTAEIKKIVLDTTLAYVETVLPDIQQFQQIYVERADLEDTFKRRTTAGLTTKAQLDTIRERLLELQTEKGAVLKRIKSKVGPYKSALDRALRYADPLTYDQMIANWEATCGKAGCNYLAVEYPEFAEPGGYQLAINAKPRFIQKALELCEGRGVLYIDGDMTVNTYPAIFDMPDVDLMARGWHIDPRSSYRYDESILVDPYTFETSGGTMFFGQTPEAHLLLQRWIEVSERFSQWGKADDRILSLVFNTYKLLLPLKIIQLPVEYLWLSLDYDDRLEREDIVLEHPECLTSEETASGQGASSDRTPKFYGTIEESYPRSEYLHEAVLFPTAEETAAFRPYLNYLKGARYFEDVEDESLVGVAPFHIIPFAEGLGPYQSVADANFAAAGERSSERPDETGTLIIRENDATTIPRILKALLGGQNVKYIPEGASDVYIHSLEHTLATFPRIELTFVNKSADMRRIFYFNSELNVGEPVFFRSGCPHLVQLVSACRSMSDLSEMLNHNYQFLSRIRVHFLKRLKMGVGAQRGGGELLDSQEAVEFLYGVPLPKALTGGRRSRRSRRSRRNCRRKRSHKCKRSPGRLRKTFKTRCIG